MVRRRRTGRHRRVRWPGAAPRDEGSALVEFLGLGLVLLVPLAYLAVAFGQLQSAGFAAEAVARQTARLLSSDRAVVAEDRVEESIALVAADFGVDPRDLTIMTSCAGDCTAGDRLTVRVEVAARLPGVPEALTGTLPDRLTLTGVASHVVDRGQGLVPESGESP